MLAELAALTLTWTAPASVAQPRVLPSFNAQARGVGGWEGQSLANLQVKASLAQKLMDMAQGDAVAPNVPRCIKLNNFWCIKGKGWAGQVASDDEGHAAFSTALGGTAAAARLIRRYYVEFNRHSAMAIVSHWAPAQCFAGVGGVVSRQDAPFGIGRTVRARWLAKHRGMVMAHMAHVPHGQAHPSYCVSGVVRVENYANAAARGITTDNNADLHLFTPEGIPTANLARLMENMAAVEIGPLRVTPDIVAAAVAQIQATP
ncbi:MAG: hypothetical protein KGQ46_10215 [Hyphomicrobiales bacterium]|nr:hypothetical protein [Hyphomicrobiales bacterium]MDE2114334.1 hypothetical protein [Hyphomicrobiales bacterium]